MAPSAVAAEFSKLVTADRDKKKKQQLADSIFNRRSSAPAAGVRKPPAGPSSLASRVSKPGQSSKPSRPANPITRIQNAPPMRRSTSQPALQRRTQALETAINGRGGARTPTIDNQINIKSNGTGLSIKGASRREYVVIAQNFAPGTTAQDIGSVFAPDGEGLIKCKLVVQSPTVIAELTFEDQKIADDCVKKFNGQKADNRVLYVYHSDAPSRPSRAHPAQTRTGASRPITISSDDSMEIEQPRPRYQQPYTPPRPQRAEPEVQDGRYGFGDDVYRPPQRSQGSGLMSDRMIGQQGGRARQNGAGRLFH